MDRKQKDFTKSLLLLLICFSFFSFSWISFAEDLDESDLNENEEFVLGDVMTNDDETVFMSYIREYKGKEKNVIIPESINGFIIIGIERNAFYHNETIETISMPQSIEYIAPSAFESCVNLKEVKGFGSVLSIKGGAFSNCIALESVVLPQTVNEIERCAFSGCSSLQEVTIPGSVKKIGEASFENCESLTNVIIEEGVEEIHVEAFRNCRSLKSICLPESVVYVGGMAFAGSGLERIEIRNDDVYIGDLAFAYNLNDLNNDLVIIGNSDSSASLMSIKLNLKFEDLNTGKISYLAEDPAAFCYEASKKAVNAAVEYLNEYYIEKYPQMAFEEKYGNVGDRAFFTELANKIVKGSNNPAWAIYSWVKNNILYKHTMYSVAYPMDVYLTKSADCQGMSILLCELLRSAGIPAALSYGNSGNMATLTYKDLSQIDVHHSCVFFYVDEKWMVADAAMNYYCNAEEIAGRFYPIEIDNIMVDNDFYSSYIWNDTGIVHEGDYVYSYGFGDRRYRTGGATYHNDDVYDRFFESIKYEDGVKATVLDGCTGLVDYEDKVLYKKYNALYATASVIEEKGKYYYCDPLNTGVFEINERVDLCLGRIFLKKGNTIKLSPVFSSTADLYDYGEMSWEVQHNDVINVDEDGNIYGVDSGYSQVYCYREQGGWWFASIYVYEPETKLKLKTDTIVVDPGKELIIDVLSKTENGSDWKKPEPEYLHRIESTDPSTVRASYSGGTVKLVGVKEGTAIVTISSFDGGASVDYNVSIKHSEVIDKAVAPTCTETGLTEGSHCSVCHVVLKAQETVAATGHKEVIDKAVDPTYTDTGLTEGSHCSVCGKIIHEQKVIPKLERNGFITESGKTYYYKDGKLQKGWQQIEKKWYYFNTSGEMQAGWQLISKKWYYFNTSGEMQTGWQLISKKWYYFNTSGEMLTGWQQIGKKWYFFKSSGEMASNEWYEGYWLNKDGTWTYKAKASWKKGSKGWWFGDTKGWYAKNQWQKIDDKWYYFDSQGYIVTGTRTIGGKTYQFSDQGVCLNP